MCGPTTNVAKRKKSVNPLRLDPTRTTTLRRQLMAQMRKRFRALKGEINKLIIDEDAFGITADAVAARDQGDMAAFLANNADSGQPGAQDTPVTNTRFRFLSNAGKVEAYQGWLLRMVGAGILEVSAGNLATPWLEPYIASAYKKGVVRAYTDAGAARVALGVATVSGASDEFLRTAFAAPTAQAKVRQLATRAFTQLKNITAQMDGEMTRILSDGLTAGKGARELARDLNKSVDRMTKKRALTVARTELIHTHSEGQLDSFEQQGLEEVGVMAEWSTAHDDHVCPLCQPLEGVVMTIKEARGMIPRHPNCRCTWIPANVFEDPEDTIQHAGQGQGLSSPGTKPTGRVTGQTFDAATTRARIKDSIQAENPKLGVAAAKEKSRWVGADKSITGKRRRRN